MKLLRLLCPPLCLLIVTLSCSTDALTTAENETNLEQVANDNETAEDANDTSSPNILLIIADDMGLDATPGYDVGTQKPNMPNLQSMVSNGLTFINVWTYPICSPTRASILTGKYGFRTNVLAVDDPLATSEVSLQSYLDQNTVSTYGHAVIGKWHLSRNVDHPEAMAVSHFAGFFGGGVQDYFNWSLVENGSSSTSTDYTTTKLTDMAIDWVEVQTKPWFLWLAYNAPHTPFHLPPADLHAQVGLSDNQANIDAEPLPYYLASLEAMDAEIGRLLASLSQEEKDNTVIIFLGDNGTPNQVAQEYPDRRVKGTLYQGGIHVPMIISGALVERKGETEAALIGSTDLFASIAEIAGADVQEIEDSISFIGLLKDPNAMQRELVYTEVGNDSGGVHQTIRNATHKYILFADGSESLYDLSTDPFERNDLLHADQLPLSSADRTKMDRLINGLAEIKQ
ncbi:MAG: sulfatase-like hydrolase/transferase [Bacteroidota bacterium]